MSKDTEQVDAKLCAYIEGELNGDERAEIEKHLDTNPRHRELLQELMQTRGVLQSLPSVAAPSAVYEAVESHLERAELLDPSEPFEESIRMSVWPRVYAMAAMVLLGLTVAIAVIVFLPNRGMPSDPITLNNNPAPDDPGVDLGRRDDDPLPGIAKGIDEHRDRSKHGKLRANAMPGGNSAKGGSGGNGRMISKDGGSAEFLPVPDGVNKKGWVDRIRNEALVDGSRFNINREIQLGRQQLAIVVEAASVNTVNGNIQDYLASNRIKWEDQILFDAAQRRATAANVAPQTDPTGARQQDVVGSQGQGQHHPIVPQKSANAFDNNLFVARGVSVEQASELAKMLENRKLNQVARVFALGEQRKPSVSGSGAGADSAGGAASAGDQTKAGPDGSKQDPSAQSGAERLTSLFKSFNPIDPLFNASERDGALADGKQEAKNVANHTEGVSTKTKSENATQYGKGPRSASDSEPLNEDDAGKPKQGEAADNHARDNNENEAAEKQPSNNATPSKEQTAQQLIGGVAEADQQQLKDQTYDVLILVRQRVAESPAPNPPPNQNDANKSK